MTLNEAAVLLGLSPGTLRVQIARKRLAATKRGRDNWVTPGAVERYRRDHQGKGGWPKGRPRKKATG